MGVFLGLCNAQLGFTLLRHVLAQAVGQLLGRVGAGGFDVSGIFGEHHEICQFRVLASVETVEVLLYEGAGHFPGAVGTEVHEQHGVAVIDDALGLAIGPDVGRLHEFVVLATLIGLFQCRHRVVADELGFAQGHGVIGRFHAIPAVVPVHGKIPANDGGYPANAQAFHFRGGFFQRRAGTAWWHVTAIQEGMDVNFFGATGCSQLSGRQNMIFMAVDAARRQQAHQVYGLVIGNSLVDGVAKGLILLEIAIFEIFVDARQALIHHAAGAEIHMAHFGVTHLALGQANKHP